MAILVTGGLGFIGSNLVDSLVDLQKKVIVIDNLSTGLKNNSNPNVEYYYEDLLNFSEIDKLINDIHDDERIETVFHLAANADVRASIENPNLTFQNNMLATYLLAELCGRLSIDRFVFTSTSAVYGEPDFLPVSEDHPIKPISPYGLSKYFGELTLTFQSRVYPTKITIFRLPNIYGFRQRSDLEGGVVAIFTEAMKSNSEVYFFGDGLQTRDWLHVNDLVAAFIKILDYKKRGIEIISMGSEVQTSLLELFEMMKEPFGYKKDPIMMPSRKGDIKDMVLSNKKARKLLNWEPQIELSNGINLV